MVDFQATYLIDATWLLETSSKEYLGATLLSVNGEDNTHLFGVIRNLLQVRQTFGITRGLVVVGKDAYDVSSAENIAKTVSFLRDFGVSAVIEYDYRVLDICVGLAPIVTHLVTGNRNLLLLANEGRQVIVIKEGCDPEVFTSEVLLSRFGIAPELVPAFLALTDGMKPAVVTKREAMSLLGQRRKLPDVVADPSIISSRRLRNTLTTHGLAILQRLEKLSPSCTHPAYIFSESDLGFNLDTDRNARTLATHSFHSLKRILSLPAKVTILQAHSERKADDFKAVFTQEDLHRLAMQLREAKSCAVDTESIGKNPHTAELLGVSLSVKEGEAFYVPVVEHEMRGVDRDAAMKTLKMFLEGPIHIVGHNLKYDYLLLRRSGIKIANIVFDTMLAAYDCFGDADFLNLKYLAKRILGRAIKSHKDIVGRSETLLDVPFHDVVVYACEHAEVSLQLAAVLRRYLEERGIDRQHRNETLPMVKILGEWEYDGVPVDLGKLRELRESMMEQVRLAKTTVISEAGVCFNPNSEKEVSAVLRTNEIISNIVGFRKINLRVLEQLAIEHKIARCIVRYTRTEKKLRKIESAIESVRAGRIHPVFSQTKTNYCRVSSVEPRLLDFESGFCLAPYLPVALQMLCADAGRSLGILADASADDVLRNDLLSAKGSLSFGEFFPLNEGDHGQLLLLIVTGVSDHHLCTRFFLDRCSIGTFRHEFKLRYSSTFLWLKKFSEETAANGFASFGGRRRYFEGLRSSNLEKRNAAERSAVRWVLGW